MKLENEKDFMMRQIHETIKLLIHLILGKKNAQEELSLETKYNLSDSKYTIIKDMVDHGEINEAENMLFDKFDRTDKSSIAELIFFTNTPAKSLPSFWSSITTPKKKFSKACKCLRQKWACKM